MIKSSFLTSFTFRYISFTVAIYIKLTLQIPGAETTGGRSDVKEGIFFGSEGQESDHSMFGPNRFPDDNDAPLLKPCVKTFMDSFTELGYDEHFK
jgi:hypothetical protein